MRPSPARDAASPTPVVCIEQAARASGDSGRGGGDACVAARRYGITSLDISPGGDKLLVSYWNNAVSLIDFVVPERGVQTFVGHDNRSFYVKSRLGPEGLHVVSGSKVRLLYLPFSISHLCESCSQFDFDCPPPHV